MAGSPLFRNCVRHRKRSFHMEILEQSKISVSIQDKFNKKKVKACILGPGSLSSVNVPVCAPFLHFEAGVESVM